MKISKIKINIPKKLIKTEPPLFKDNAKLMIFNKKTGKIIHEKLKNIIFFFKKNDLIIRNNTKSLPYELIGKKEKTKSIIKIFLLKEIRKKKNIWDTLVKPARKVRIGNKIFFYNKKKKKILTAEIIDNTTSRGRIIKFINKKKKNIKKIIKSISKIKIQKYINKNYLYNIQNYQNIYSKKKGSVLFPTSGIHFSKNLFLKLILKGINITDITLHNNFYNIKKINIEDLSKYKISSEKLIIKNKTCNIVNKTKKNNNNICCLGINTLKGIEYSINSKNNLIKYNGYINKFIYHPYKFNIANSLISLFYYPKTISFIMLATFCGYDKIIKIYNEAIKKKYNFLSYGDLILIK
ncbi:MAG: S-adenosylmethionine:tRNA ribosyltransferase-isomerase [Candidatus Shikimatogenerans bostrichidophilus]|nr:MAG: S-adenosylmethionine:tRNA ribosyltransferase-isomerase [Candidatus Shikimatogenerans bostrichidophilus]